MIAPAAEPSCSSGREAASDTTACPSSSSSSSTSEKEKCSRCHSQTCCCSPACASVSVSDSVSDPVSISVSATSTISSSSSPAAVCTSSSSCSNAAAAATSWPCSAQSYEQSVKIEQGNFSEVWSALCKPMGQKVCIKVLDLEKISASFEDILQEVQAMRLSDDPNILNCYCSFVHKDQLWLITHLMNKGSCLRVMSISKQLNFGEGMDEECVGYILSETLKGLNYLHQRGHIHRDVKCGNILLDESGAVRLSDFGVNRWTMTLSATERTTLGSPCHAAPELIEEVPCDNRVDIWSLGITALELAKGSAPYSELPPAKTIKMILNEDPPSLKNYLHDKQLHADGAPFSKFFEDFYKRCLQKNSKIRPSSIELLKHKFLRGRSSLPLIAFLSKIHNVDSQTEIELQHSSIGETLQDFEVLADEVLHADLPGEDTPTLTENSDPSLNIEGCSNQWEKRLVDKSVEQSFVPGTSWIFDVEDVVRRKGNTSMQVERESIKDFLEEFDQNDASM